LKKPMPHFFSSESLSQNERGGWREGVGVRGEREIELLLSMLNTVHGESRAEREREEKKSERQKERENGKRRGRSE